MTALIKYVGMSKGGIAQTGQSTEKPSVVAERLWRRGYQWLRITDDGGAELGGIVLNEGKRIWWAES